MLQTVMPRGEAPVDYQMVVAGVLQLLAGANNKISGIDIQPASMINQVEFMDAIGIKPLIKFFTSINSAFHQYQLNIENLVVKGEKVMVKYTIRGVFTGRLMGLEASVGAVQVTGLDVFRLDQGQVAEYWNASRQIEPLKK